MKYEKINRKISQQLRINLRGSCSFSLWTLQVLLPKPSFITLSLAHPAALQWTSFITPLPSLLPYNGQTQSLLESPEVNNILHGWC